MTVDSWINDARNRPVIDIESGLNSTNKVVVENPALSDDMNRKAVCYLSISVDELAKGENPVSQSCSPKKIGELSPAAGANGMNKNEKRKSLSAKKPPKPPRPPRGLSLDAADQKLIKELSELAMIRRARIERMRTLKKMKAAKAASLGSNSSSGNWIAVLFTFLFCFVLLFQGCHFPGNSTSSSRDIAVPGLLDPSGAPQGDIIMVHSHRNLSSGVPLIDA